MSYRTVALRLLMLLADSPARSGVRFLVHRANLGASFNMLAKMFASVPAETQGDRAVTHLEESASVLDRMHPSCYPQRTPPVDLKHPEAWEEALPLLTCFDKYEVSSEKSPPSVAQLISPPNSYGAALKFTLPSSCTRSKARTALALC